MRYIKPPDFKSVKDLQEHYKKLEQDITDLLFSDASINTAEELNKKLSLALSASLSYLTKINKTYVEKEFPIAFKEGQSSSSNLKEVPKKTAAAILAKQGFKYAKNGFSYDTYIELQTATKTALNGIKTQVNDIIKDLRKDGQDSIYNVRETLLKELQKHNLTSVKYSNGAEMPLNAYAAMVARSARIETTNISAIGGALEAGTDLVKMTSVSQCCKLCGAYQGKVYSISGKDKRFPALFKTVLKNGYALPHPNCRHEFIPWFEEAESPEDVEKAIKNSKIKYDGKGNLVDVRYQKDIEAYQAWQAGNRQLNREMLEFEQMQAYYKGREDEMPYKTLASFRRARRAQAQSFKDNRKEWNIIADTSKYGVKYPKPKSNNREVIESKLYETKIEQIVPKEIVRKTIVAAREILRENNRLNEETAIAITLSGERILKQHEKGLNFNVDMSVINKQPNDSVVLIHNHPRNDTFSIDDLLFMSHKQIHTMIVCTHNGKIFFLRINCGKMFDNCVESTYNKLKGKGLTHEAALVGLCEEYEWEYKEL